MKMKGDLAELKVAADIRARGHKIALPYGEDWLFDLVVMRHGALERVQVKHGRSDGRTLEVRALTLTITAGKVQARRKYTATDIDWLAVWDSTTDQSAYVPARELGSGMCCITLRLEPARNGQRRGVRMLQDYLEF
ncbi:MAG: group I intron-associated PD-(D/E)XK endonuclease [Baekduiaceae bacterium]